MHRTQITLTDTQYARLRDESARSGRSLAELVRRALDERYEAVSKVDRLRLLDIAFGAWAHRGESGVEFVERVRSADAGKAASAQSRGTGAEPKIGGSASRFVASSRRMALTLRQTPASRRTDPGAALIDLLGFADAVTRGQPARQFEPLSFPVLRKLVEHRRGAAGMHRG